VNLATTCVAILATVFWVNLAVEISIFFEHVDRQGLVQQ
jgi:hypothetical protein